jgi:uncharacterized protein YecE (DUF72 family)
MHLGTTSFNCSGWPGSFYPKGLNPTEYLHHYSTRFDTVEIDSTFYKIPKLDTVHTWSARTPPGFIISLKSRGLSLTKGFLWIVMKKLKGSLAPPRFQARNSDRCF